MPIVMRESIQKVLSFDTDMANRSMETKAETVEHYKNVNEIDPNLCKFKYPRRNLYEKQIKKRF